MFSQTWLTAASGLDSDIRFLLNDASNQRHLVWLQQYCNKHTGYLILSCKTSLHKISKLQNFKRGETGLLLTLVLMLWGWTHFDGHAWRWVIVPPDLAQSFCTIFTYISSLPRVIPHRLNVYVTLSPYKGNTCLTKLLGRLCYKKSGSTITHLHM